MNIRKQRLKDGLFVLFGALFFAFFNGMPFIVSYITLPEDRAFTPVLDLNHHVSDAYYYAPFVRNMVDNGLNVSSIPTSTELRDNISMEAFRSSGLRLAAIPALFTTDMRYVFLFGMMISGALYFILPYSIARHVGMRRWSSVVCSVVVYFYTSTWWASVYAVPLYGGNPFTISAWKLYFYSFIKFPFFRFYDMAGLDLLGDVWRYVNISHSGIVLLVFFYSLMLIVGPKRINGKIWPAVLFGVVFVFLSYSYPSHLVVGFGITSFTLLMFAYQIATSPKPEKNSYTRQFLMLFIPSLCAGLVLLLFDYPSRLNIAMNESVLWKIISYGKFEWLNSSTVSTIFSVLTNKYILTGIIALWVTVRYFSKLIPTVLPLLLTGLGLSLLFVFRVNHITGRFFGRGIDLLWVLCLTILVCNFYQVIMKPFLYRNLRKFFARKIRKRLFIVGESIIITFLTLTPYIGILRYSYFTAKGNVFSIPVEEWETLVWLRNNSKSMQSVAALDWKDITRIPVYTSLGVIAGNLVLDGRQPREEIKRFCALWKALGLPKEHFADLVKSTIPSAMLFLKSALSKTLSPPFVSDHVFNSSQVAQGLVYWPYIQEVDGVFVSNSQYETTNDFFNLVMADYDQILPDSYLKQADFIVLSGDYLRMNYIIPQGYHLSFHNKTHNVYSREFSPPGSNN